MVVARMYKDLVIDTSKFLREVANNYLLCDKAKNKTEYLERRNFADGYVACLFDLGVIDTKLDDVISKSFRRKVHEKKIIKYVNINDSNNPITYTPKFELIKDLVCEKFGVDDIEEAYIKCMISSKYTSKDMDIVRIFFAKKLIILDS